MGDGYPQHDDGFCIMCEKPVVHVVRHMCLRENMYISIHEQRSCTMRSTPLGIVFVQRNASHTLVAAITFSTGQQAVEMPGLFKKGFMIQRLFATLGRHISCENSKFTMNDV